MGVQFRTVGFWYGVAFGLFIASAEPVMVLAAFSMATPEYWGAVAALSAIPVTIFAALVALLVARYQMEQQRRQDLEAARAVLPLALAQIHDVIGHGLRLCASNTPDPEDVLPRLAQL
ncbi:MAG: hypothetical protein GYB53_13240 [Rhodobacteraceae bacterium]|nr:hypothetical protein [Paracoccaceae bacterium]MBR9821237.1 hypothetical protein [Paracoccaceae bacterium]